MPDGSIRVATATPSIRVSDCAHNADKILSLIKKAERESIRFFCLPELCLTGYTCGDLFLQMPCLKTRARLWIRLSAKARAVAVLVAAGFPLAHGG